MTTELAIRRKEILAVRDGKMIDATRDVVIALIQQPVTGMVLGVAMVETLSKLQLIDGVLAKFMDGVVLTGPAMAAISGATSSVLDIISKVKGL